VVRAVVRGDRGARYVGQAALAFQKRWGLLKNTNLHGQLALRNSGKTQIVSLQTGLFQQARWFIEATRKRHDLMRQLAEVSDQRSMTGPAAATLSN
jgi:hypothetical protein